MAYSTQLGFTLWTTASNRKPRIVDPARYDVDCALSDMAQNLIYLVGPSNESDSALWDLAKNLISALFDMTQSLIARRETLTLAWS